MQKFYFDISRSQFYPKIISDYINNPEKLKSFYRYKPEISSFKNVIENFSNAKFNRELLAEVLNEQYSKAGIQFPKYRHNAEVQTQCCIASLLTDKNTFTVCTGHQLCIFTGPLYFIYKIISTINLADELKKKYTEYNFIPVYWMASEDHDFDEINHIHVFGKKIEWLNKQGGATGNYTTSGLEEIISELKNILSESENSRQLINLFSEAYLKNINLADATRYLVNELFGEYGLLIIDANDKRLKKEFSSIISDDIFNNTNYKLVNVTITELNKLSYKHQVNPREINLFYLDENERKRIENADEKFTAEIKTNPQKFSPNVVLRPLYQQKILPNIAYVGGPNEIAYWLQYKKMFDHHKINFPVLMLRNSVLWIDEKSSGKLYKLKLDYTDLFDDVNIIIKKYLLKNSSGILSLNDEKEKLKNIFSQIFQKAESIDITLKTAAEAELHRTLSAIDNLEKKLLKAEKQKNETTINQIKNLKEKLFPENNLQERHENFIPHYLKYGKNFFEILKENLNPFDARLLILEEGNQ